MKEAFVATLLELARSHDGDSDSDGDDSGDDGDDGDDPLDKYEFWRYFKATVRILRKEMSSDKSADASSHAGLGLPEGFSTEYEEMVPLLDGMNMQGGPQPRKAVSSQAKPMERQQGAFGQDNSVLSPIHSFAPLVPERKMKLR